MTVDDVRRSLEEAAGPNFSGVVRVDRPGERSLVVVSGWADRRYRIPITERTVFGIASGAKTVTALVVLALVERGLLTLDTPARSLLGGDLPLVDGAVTVEHLLAHRSGIGDYLDEDAVGPIEEFFLPVPVHRLDSTEAYLAVLDGHGQVFEPGERFAYNNAGYVVLALLAERAAATPFPALVRELVSRPAGLTDTGFLRSDELPPGVATGYLAETGLRTNVFHLPVLGSGDGGLFTTVGDVTALWAAVRDGAVVGPASVTAMTTCQSTPEGSTRAYGWGLWLDDGGATWVVEGSDAGVSFRSMHHAASGATATVVSNTTAGAWPVARAAAALVRP